MDTTTLAILNAQINGTPGISMDAALSAVTARTDDIGFCGNNCTSTCDYCTHALSVVQAFYSNEKPVTVTVMAPAHDGTQDEDQTWEETVMAARALDEAEEAARTGMMADQNFDGHDNADLDDDDHCDCGCDGCDDWDYDDRQDRYYDDDWNTGLDWNEGGYFD